MAMAALRGVRIRLVLPSVVDYHFMRWAADAYLWQLLEHGIEVYRRPPPFVHTKLLIADRRWVLFGSANLDPRSFRLNFEFNVEAYDATLAERLSVWLDERIAESQRVTLEQMDSRPTWRRLRDGVAKVFSPYL
jgi:cardiolipin synthase